MKRLTAFPHQVREIENVFIPMPDGTRLAGRAWLPTDADGKPVPAILEFIPYRKRDFTALRDAANHGYLAGHGYACLRVDARGVGDSEGLYGDQFSEQYDADAVAIIEWLATQRWCDGQVAMFGLSWGGAIQLQAASRRPTALKTIVCGAGIDDRHSLRFPGGCLSTNGLATILHQVTYSTRPPDPTIVGQAWRETWQTRLDAVETMTQTWLGHPLRDDYWRKCSLADDYSLIACPVMIAVGWNDPAFAASMLRVLEHLKVPRKAIIGPWGHRYPHVGLPGPAIGYLQETLRWLDHWLKGAKTGVMEEPDLRFWMRESSAISARPETVKGRWLAEPAWPSPGIKTLRLTVDGGGRLGIGTPSSASLLEIPNEGVVGAAGGEAMPIFTTGHNPELAGDQQGEDRCSLCLDGTPLEARLECLGTPVVTLVVTADKSFGQIAVRLCEVLPTGASRRVTYGFVNLATATDAATGAALKAGTPITLRIRLYPIADGFDQGNRLRVALSSTYWPMLWPSRERVTISVDTSGSALELPGRAYRADEATVTMPEPEAAPSMAYREIAPYGYWLAEDVEAGSDRQVITIADDNGSGEIVEIGLTIADSTTRRFAIDPADPASATLDTVNTCSFSRGTWSASAVTTSRVVSTADNIIVETELTARTGDEIVARRTWRDVVARGPF